MKASWQRPDDGFAAVSCPVPSNSASERKERKPVWTIEFQPLYSLACCLSTVCSAVRLGVRVRAMGRDKSIKRPVSLRRSALFILSVRERRGREKEEDVMCGRGTDTGSQIQVLTSMSRESQQ